MNLAGIVGRDVTGDFSVAEIMDRLTSSLHGEKSVELCLTDPTMDGGDPESHVHVRVIGVGHPDGDFVVEVEYSISNDEVVTTLIVTLVVDRDHYRAARVIEVALVPVA